MKKRRRIKTSEWWRSNGALHVCPCPSEWEANEKLTQQASTLAPRTAEAEFNSFLPSAMTFYSIWLCRSRLLITGTAERMHWMKFESPPSVNHRRLMFAITKSQKGKRGESGACTRCERMNSAKVIDYFRRSLLSLGVPHGRRARGNSQHRLTTNYRFSLIFRCHRFHCYCNPTPSDRLPEPALCGISNWFNFLMRILHSDTRDFNR